METASGKETIIVLRRLIAYSEKIFQLSKDIVTRVSDRREKPRISTAAVGKSSLVLFWARMGSSNAWEQVGRARFWQRWLGERAFRGGRGKGPAFIGARDSGLSAGLRFGARRRALRQGAVFQLSARSRQTRSGGSQRGTPQSLSGRGWIIQPCGASAG